MSSCPECPHCQERKTQREVELKRQRAAKNAEKKATAQYQCSHCAAYFQVPRTSCKCGGTLLPLKDGEQVQTIEQWEQDTNNRNAEVWRLRNIENLTYRAIAEHLGISVERARQIDYKERRRKRARHDPVQAEIDARAIAYRDEQDALCRNYKVTTPDGTTNDFPLRHRNPVAAVRHFVRCRYWGHPIHQRTGTTYKKTGVNEVTVTAPGQVVVFYVEEN
jgi:hypothetical protein